MIVTIKARERLRFSGIHMAAKHNRIKGIKTRLKRFTKTSRTNKVIAIVVVLAVIGASILLVTRAGGFFAATETENGTRSGNVQLISDSSASGGKAVQFTAPATPPPPTSRSCPAFPSFPDASCTGVTPGVSLTIVNGDQTYGSSFNGQTISGKDFRGLVRVTGANITFKDCIFRGRAVTANARVVDTEDSTGTITFQDIEVAPSNPAATLDGMGLKNTNVYRAHVRGGVDGIKTFGNVIVEDSYIHDMNWFASDPNQGGGETHNDGVQSWAGLANTTVRHNRIDMSTTKNANAAWQNSSPNSLAEYNYLDGGGCTLNFSHAGQPTLQPMYVRNNHFGRHQFFSGCVILISTKTVLTQYSGNVWDDTGAPTPAPQQHD